MFFVAFYNPFKISGQPIIFCLPNCWQGKFVGRGLNPPPIKESTMEMKGGEKASKTKLMNEAKKWGTFGCVCLGRTKRPK